VLFCLNDTALAMLSSSVCQAAVPCVTDIRPEAEPAGLFNHDLGTEAEAMMEAPTDERAVHLTAAQSITAVHPVLSGLWGEQPFRNN